jgi:hypothetical protein
MLKYNIAPIFPFKNKQKLIYIETNIQYTIPPEDGSSMHFRNVCNTAHINPVLPPRNLMNINR